MVVLAGGRIDLAVGVPWAVDRRRRRPRRRRRDARGAYPARLASRLSDRPGRPVRVAEAGAMLDSRPSVTARRDPRTGSLDDDRHPAARPQPAAERGLTLADFLVPIRVAERIDSRVRHIALIVLGALFIALSAQIYIPSDRPCRSPARRSASCSSAGRSASGAGRRVALYLALGAGRPAGLRRGQGRAGGPPRRDRRLPHRVRRRGRARRPAGRARLGPPTRRRARDDGHRQRRHLRDRRAVAHGRHGHAPVDGHDRQRPDAVPRLGRGQAARSPPRCSRPPGGSSAAGPDDR